MKLPRRQFLHLAAGAAVLPAVPRLARAQAYPTRPVRFVVGFAPGGGGDLATRLMGQWLSERLGQQFVVENRVGAASNLATEQVVHAPPDGYTLIQLNVANAINASLYSKLSFDVLRDLPPVASFMRVPNVMEISPTLPVRRFPNSSPMRRPIPERSCLHPRASARRSTCPANCSRRWPQSTSCTSPIAVSRRAATPTS